MKLVVALGCISSLMCSTMLWAETGAMPKPAEVQITVSAGSQVQNLPFDKTIRMDNDDGWSVDVNGPDGNYSVEWTCDVAAAESYHVKADLFKANGNQFNYLLVSLNDGKTWDGVGNDKEWTWQEKENTLFDPVLYAQGIRQKISAPKIKLKLAWRFSKPHKDGIWRTGLRKISITPVEAKAALAEFQKPLEKGLPDVALPPAQGITTKPNWQVKDDTLLRDGRPFFPIGFVMFDTGDRHLGQAAAMGANAVHFDIGWSSVMTNPGDLADPAAIEATKARLQRMGQWGLVTFPLMIGHYVPEWFLQAHPAADNAPLGSDGNRTGAWFPYSIHYPPFKKSIAQFWTNITPLLQSQPNVVASNFWNEPAYGGIWCSPNQFGDYHRDSIENFRHGLKNKYPTMDQLNKRWNTRYADWKSIQPPKSPDEINRAAWIDWMRFGQTSFADFFQWERRVIHQSAPHLWLTNKKQTNPLDNSACSSATNWFVMGKSEDLFGVNAYEGPSYETTMNLASSMAQGKPVIVFETNVMPVGATLRTPERIRKQLWSQLVGGARGMFLFCMDKNPEHGLLDDASVSPSSRPEYTRFMQTVNKFGAILALPNQPASVAILYSTSATLHYPNSTKWPGSFIAAYSLVRNSQYMVDVLPEEKCDLESLKKYKVIVIPSYTILPEHSLKALDAYVKNEGKILAFGHCLDRDEDFVPCTTPPPCLGIQTREKPLGDRDQLRLIVQDKDLAKYIADEFDICGVEKITAFKERTDQLVMGKGITTAEPLEKVLAVNSDSYPSMITTQKGHVVYCAFEARNIEPMRRLVEGTLREEFKVKQSVRFVTAEGSTSAPVMLRLIRDIAGNKIYILALNTGSMPQTLSLDTVLKPARELFHGEKNVSKKTIRVKPYEVYLIETTH